ncbi:choice-of-anchor D domain-containing protein [Actinacidiphila epipremni]|uniref:Choice-of-anchor D domain-containing protein n=1 Tax=Actinacidiphila epipremni TaxID=2053013 RepID=A0ABX0ZR45_9ACTN|nr:choice-of-anchor D domain-containing protein [Actinacidiphila epipremni]NJP45467.1 choice-of-anchor D domain-containing protein [Actinacidiphila epipremni]
MGTTKSSTARGTRSRAGGRAGKATGTRGPRSRLALAVTAALTAALLGAGLGAPSPAGAGETTGSVDTLRTGWDQNEPGLGPADVRSSSFGQLWKAPAQLDGQIYAQPVVVGGTVIVVTENNVAYGLDRATGAIQWQRGFGPAWPASALGCGDLTPTVGSTATPVYDPASGAVYLTTKVNDGPGPLNPHWYMHALDPVTGAEKSGFPVTIQGTPADDPSQPFLPAYEMQRPGLLLLDGVVYAGFGGHCDAQPYRGYVVGVSTTSPSITSMWATETGASNSGAGVWLSGGGLVSDGPGRIFLATGNGVSPAPGPGTSPPGTLAESVVRLQVQGDRSLKAADFFSPSDAPALDQQDTDLGSGGPVGLPDSFGTPSHPHLMVQQGKDGRVFLLDRDRLGGSAQGPGGTDAAVGVTGPLKGQWGHPAVWGGDGGYVYLVGNGGSLTALHRGVTGAGDPALAVAGTSQDAFPYTSGSPVVTSDGSRSGSALVWVVWSGGPTGVNAQLRAYSPVPDANGVLPLVWSAPVGTAAKFATPATDGGQVFIGTREGKVYAFGNPVGSPLKGGPAEFGQVAVGASAHADVVLTENQNPSKALGIRGVSVDGPFTADTSALPPSIPAGGHLTVPVTFTPTGVLGASGTLTVTTDAGSFALSLHGVGTKPGLAAFPAAVAFDDQPTGTTATTNVQLTNTGTQAETITAVTAPTGPFTAANLPSADPADPTVIPAQGSIVLQVGYTPTATGDDTSSIALSSTSGALAIPLSGNAISGQGHLVLNPSPLNFGAVVRGSSSTRSFTITNTGNVPVTVTKAKAPAGVFTSSDPLAEGLVIGPEQSVRQTVTFSPTATGSQSATYEVTGDAGQGAQFETLTGTGVPPAGELGTLLARDTGGVLWQYHGTGVAATPLSVRSQIGPAWNAYDLVTSVSREMSDGTGTMVARDGSGVLWYYAGTGDPAAPFAPKAWVGTGWGQYTTLTGTGDLTGDGRADLIARDASGTLWLYPGTGSATAPFAARTTIGPGWNQYANLVGTGDLTGDGKPDLVARDASGTLWLYQGTGSAAAPFAARTTIGPGWNMFTALAATGDVTGDARPDLVGRDASGTLWLYQATGSAASPFLPRTSVGPGWNTYNSLI